MSFPLRWAAGLALATLALALWATLTPPGHLYRLSGEFAGCPARPSCVSSLAGDDAHRVLALNATADPHTAQVALRELLERQGGQIEHEAAGHLHAVFVQPPLGLRDDLELLILPEGRIEVRSLSRFGYTDGGRNRQRVEALRRAFEASP